MFFLDAHIQDFDPQYYNKRCPLFEELEAIKTMGRNDNIILIDDLRIISSFFWHEKSYGNINFLQKIKELLLTINKDYKFSTLNGECENDVLMAYV